MFTAAQLHVIARDYRQRAEAEGLSAKAGVCRLMAAEFERDALRLAHEECREAALQRVLQYGVNLAPHAVAA